MKTNIAVGARFQSRNLVALLQDLKQDFVIYSSVPSKRFQVGQEKARVKFVPLFASIAKNIFHLPNNSLEIYESFIYDQMTSKLMRKSDVLYGWAGFSLECGKKVKQRGGVFVLDRPCPHLLFQENILQEEAEKLKIHYKAKPKWWIERAIKEYDEADVIVVSSRYTANTFLDKGFKQEKILLTPLDRPFKIPPQKLYNKNKEFVVGCLGGNITRKGFLYLLQAWEKLDLKNAKLILKASQSDLRESSVLAGFLDRNSNIEVIEYFTDISDFYDQCDLFVLPSVDDGFGQVITEALSFGIPCIATSNVGASELFQDTEAVSIISPRNADEIASQISDYYENRGLVEERGRMAREVMTKKSNEETQYQKAIQKLYFDLIPKIAKRN